MGATEMNEDRKLLEWAAKAAGKKIDKSPYNGGGADNTGFDCMGRAVLDWHNGKFWDPLGDDGDALRLVVKLGIGLYIKPGKYTDAAYEFATVHRQNHNSDPHAATRRAIVRAAAAIGEEMK
jgi:hypothetical protein